MSRDLNGKDYEAIHYLSHFDLYMFLNEMDEHGWDSAMRLLHGHILPTVTSAGPGVMDDCDCQSCNLGRNRNERGSS